jgi:hypothetical protein
MIGEKNASSRRAVMKMMPACVAESPQKVV